jgi:ribose-phosphate pyrophosphokinase
VEVASRRYPNGELVGLNLLSDSDGSSLQIGSRCHVTWRWESDSDLVSLMFLKKHLDATFACEVALTITYMPYSRMDRVEEAGTCFTLSYVAEFINSLGFYSVTVMEPHSEVTLSLLDRSRAAYPVAWVATMVLGTLEGPVVVVFPDAGAAARYRSTFGEFTHLVGEKSRDFSSGRITGLTITPPEGWRALPGTTAVIVDDLCSRGGTFLATGEILRRDLGISAVVLCVTHLEANVFNGDLLEDGSPVDHIYTTDALAQVQTHKNVTTYEMEK